MLIIIDKQKVELSYKEIDLKFKNLIYKIVWTFKRNVDFDFDDYYHIAFIGYLNARKKYDINKESNFINYISTSITNELCQHIRKITPFYYDIEEFPNLVDEFDFDNIDNKIYVEKLLNKLNFKDRELIKLYYFNDLSQITIGKMQKVTTTCISRKLKVIIQKIKEGEIK
jgi:RNA polymerase sigma factor (sigma-70 family)